MLLISSRVVPFIDPQSLASGQAREALFRKDEGFILYLSNGAPSATTEERLVYIGLREALIWLNEPPEDRGSFWG